jgi:hypothetical protein
MAGGPARRLYCCDEGLMKVASLRVTELGIELLPALIFA